MIEIGFVENVVLMIMSSKVGEWSVKFWIDFASAEMFYVRCIPCGPNVEHFLKW